MAAAIRTLVIYLSARSETFPSTTNRTPIIAHKSPWVSAASAILTLAILSFPAAAQDAGTTQNQPSVRDVSFAGRVVDFKNANPIADVAILVERSLAPQKLLEPNPSWVGSSEVRTDANGRFQHSFPAEQVADRRLRVALSISHPGFIPRKSGVFALATIVRRQSDGDRPFFETIRLERGVEYTAQVVTPTGKPAPHVPFFLENWSWSKNDSPGFFGEQHGRTDEGGRVRLWSAKSQAVALYVFPSQLARASFPYAPYQHFWGVDRPSDHPDVWVSTDLGRIVLPRGVRVVGRVVDLEGRPIGGQTITAYAVRGRDRHTATTEADGTFALGPLRAANYHLYGTGQDGFGGVDETTPSLPESARILQPVAIYLEDGVIPEPIVLHEVPTFEVSVQFVDSQGKPAAGGPVKLTGSLPLERPPGNALGREPVHPNNGASAMNEPESEDTSTRVSWGVLDRPDAQGRVVVRAPQGLQDAILNTYPPDETIAYKTFLNENAPLKYWGGGLLGRLEADRRITIVSFRAATVLLTVKTDDGGEPKRLNVVARFSRNFFSYAEGLRRHTDGRFNGGLMPDHEYEITVTSDDYVPNSVPRINLPEGARTDLTVTLRRRPELPQIGKPAAPFSVQTSDGKKLALADLRGKFVLLHFWAPRPNNHLTEVVHLKAVSDRFGHDPRLAIVSLCMVADPELHAVLIKQTGPARIHVMLRDQTLARIAVDFAAAPPPKSFLISPDGKLIAKDLKGNQNEKAVIDALRGGTDAPTKTK